MATTIKTRNSVTTTVVPTSLAQGELAVNITDKKIWVGNAATTPVLISDYSGSIIGGSNTQVQYNSSGAFAGSANFTFNGTTLILANDASISGLTVGKGGGSQTYNTSVGASALATNSTGNFNSAFGNVALNANTTGGNNAAFGYAALNSNTTGGSNTAYGMSALQLNTTASNNTAVGYQAGYSNQTGTGIAYIGHQAGYYSTSSYTTFAGYRCGYNNTTGENTAYGANTLFQNTTGTANTALGGTTTAIAGALASNTTGSYNTSVGVGSLTSNTTASNNTAVGYQASYNNTTGVNTSVGMQALYANTTGTFNTAIGGQNGAGAPLGSNSTGSYNVAVGFATLANNSTASNNTAVGYQAGYSNTTGTPNTYLGYQAGYTGATNNACTALGFQALYSNTGNGNTAVGGGDNSTYGGALSSNTTGVLNTAIGAGSGSAITTGSRNSILGRYNGNQGGLDIRTANNYIVLSDGDGNPRFYVNNSGDYYLNTTTAWGAGKFKLGYAQNLNWGMEINDTTSASGAYAIAFGSGGTRVGQISTTSSATTYATSSDYRLKENIQPMTGALDKVSQLKPCTYTWKLDGTPSQGFIAHELQAVIPEAVTGEKDGVDEDGKPHYQGVDTSFLVATLTAAIQELKAEVDSLRQQLGK